MYKICLTERSARRQSQILEHFAAMVAARGYGKVTIRQLCAELQLPRKTFYRYFGSKEELLDALLDKMILDLSALLQEPDNSLEQAEKQMEQIYAAWYEQRELLCELLRSRRADRLLVRSLQFMHRENIGSANNELLGGGTELERRLVRRYFICGMYGILTDWAAEGFASSPGELARCTLKIVSRPLYRPLEKNL